ncbi:MAG TPA: hypothetical protein VFB90_00215 [Dehalococcoidia bacterium]|nr:hypothetical protein [Dehalococcoidia bacterium]
MILRSTIAGFLLVLGALLSVPASLAVWQDRAVLNEDHFVTTAEEALADDAVQQALAQRMTHEVLTRLDVQSTIANRPDLAALQAILPTAIHDAVYDVCLSVLRSDSLAPTRDAMLRASHRAVKALLLGDSRFIQQNGERIMLDLRPMIYEVVRQLGGEVAVQQAQAIAGPDFGTIALVQGPDIRWLRDIGDWIDRANPLLPVLAGAALLAAIAIAVNHVRMLAWAGGALVLAVTLTLLLLHGPVRELATGWVDQPGDRAAARAIYGTFLDSFQAQEVVLGLMALGVAIVSLLASLRPQPGGARRGPAS